MLGPHATEENAGNAGSVERVKPVVLCERTSDVTDRVSSERLSGGLV